ncbi:MarR family winged helix-turn-helix transcriptional regulator [Anthocerotibacter panamensis]|uniref:MarR family winged helix-turn-helix transcriptional regulator n=1 Tax=Anthocerotibacter panamensis TaxID=2857077 RepID=UPI001C40832C|nr:MarR family winged helix-turn-helix transcriptional regulator [Anthocerotibacter panamensis]
MTRLVFTPKEASLLTALDDEESLPTLAASTKMTPSKVRQVVQELQTKGLIEPIASPFVKLTTKGRVAHRRLKHNLDTVVITDEPSFVMSATEIDDALEYELARLGD